MKKSMKIMSVMLMVVMVLFTMTTMVSASGSGFYQPEQGPEGLVDPVNLAGSLQGTNTSASGSVANIGNQIIGIITTVGVVVAVIILLVLGIKYMMGSASEKAEYKKTMIPYLVGAILIFGASAITKVVVNLASNIKA